MAGETVQIQHQGILLNASMELAEGRQPSDGLIILLHGTLGHKDMEIIQGLQELFLDSGRSTLAISLSYGVSNRQGFFGCDQVHMHRNQDALTELNAWMNWAHEQGAHNLVLLGHSRGANQVVRYAVETGVPVRALVLMAPMLREAQQGTTLATDSIEPDSGALHLAQSFLHCENTRVSAESFASYYGADARTDTLEMLADIPIRTLLITGSDDDSINKTRDALDALSNPLVEKVDIDGAGHFFRDLYSDDAVEHIIQFLDKPQETEASSSKIRHGAAGSVVRATDLHAAGHLAQQQGVPLVLFLSRSDCSYCERLRQAVLEPMLRQNAFAGKALLREVSLDQGEMLRGFDRAAEASMQWAEKYRASITPTLLFLSPTGSELADRLVGIPNIEYYRYYFLETISSAAQQLAQ